jgi:pyruvate carboxylase
VTKLLVANRSEIAIRCFRAATELGLRTVAVYSHEDRFSLHRFKADEAFLVGPADGGAPVRSYLDIDEILRVARQHGVDAIHPGYGFLSESAAFARACRDAGVVFIGPTPEQLEIFGDKLAAKSLAQRVKVPTVPGTAGAATTPGDMLETARALGFPLIVKASFGGGGRGMRVVHDAGELASRLEEAQREAGTAFGRAEVFLERYVARARHIEVQVLGDHHGGLVHLFERDCSVQRRHQKVVEVAPAVGLDPEIRRAMTDAALGIAAAVRYQSAGTVEFLLDLDAGAFFFIEVNPRIQVEHTVTEMVTGLDLVRSQILVAQGHALHEAPLDIPVQDRIETRGVALQCRITTEDPENGFTPDYGRITTYRSPGGFAVRLDGGNGFGGAVITPYFDSLLVKLTTWGPTLEEAVRRADRSLKEFRIRGVKTNIAFLENLITHPTFTSGSATTTFVDSAPELYQLRAARDRATKILGYLADVVVNGRPDVARAGSPARELPSPVAPVVDEGAPPSGYRQRLLALGPERFARWVREEPRLLLTDTTMRDAHQSLLATRVRTFDLLAVADAVAHLVPDLFSLEMWGGATFDTTMRFLQEDPWDRLVLLRRRIPNVLFQMLLRGSNAVGYTTYPDNVVRAFVERSAARGIDVFRIFDALNATANMEVAIAAVRERTQAVCEAAICYTGDMLDPARPKYNLRYYVRKAKELVAMGAHIVAIKDMAGLCKPAAAYELVRTLRDEVDVPIHFHTHDPSGLGGASVLRAADAGVDIADGAMGAMSGMTSQPCLNSIVAALRHTPRDTGIDQRALDVLNRYWADVRQLYYPFDEGLNAPSADVYQHEMPGGQYTNLWQQAKSLGLDGDWPAVCEAFAAANQLFGDIVKVTPSSKVVGDMALFMVTNRLTPADIREPRRPLHFPTSVVEMMRGALGEPDGGWPSDVRKVILDSARAEPIEGRPGAALPPVDFERTTRDLQTRLRRKPSEEDVLSYLLYPQVFLDYEAHVRRYDNTSVVPTRNFFFGLQPGEEISVEIEPGKTLIVLLLAIGEVHEDGTRAVFFELNGQPRQVTVRDRSEQAVARVAVKADPADGRHVPAPMPGQISRLTVATGQTVKAGEPLLSIEAMKMETAVYAPSDGIVAEVLVQRGTMVEAHDLLVRLAEH